MPILRAPNTDRLIKGKPKTYLTAASASGGGTLTVESIAGFSVGVYAILGVLGEERTEIVRLHTSTAPSGSTITLNANTSYRHEIGTPVQLTDYNQVRFYRDTETVTADALFADATALAAAADISVDQMESIYDDTTNTTGHGFYQFQNSATSAAASASDPIPYTGFTVDAAHTILIRALSQATAEVSPRLQYDRLFDFLNDAISIMNARSKRWSETKVLDSLLDSLATGDWEFNLPSTIASKTDPSAIISVRIRGYKPLVYKPMRDWNLATYDLQYSTVATTFTSAATTIVLTSSYDFNDSGTVMIDGDTISYTGNTRSTGTLTGVTGIASTHTAGTYAFQNFDQNVPQVYTVSSSGKIRIYPIVPSDLNNRALYISYYREIPSVDSLGDRVLVENVEPLISYVAYRIKKYVSGGAVSPTDDEYKTFLTELGATVSADSPSEPIRVNVDH